MSDESDQVIEEFFEGEPRAEQLAAMIEALEQRRVSFQREREAAPPDRRKEWDSRLRAVDKQIAVLRQEQAISGFVEHSIRQAMQRPRPAFHDDIDE